MNNKIIGKLGEATVIVHTYMHHDTIYISPKEEKMMRDIIDIVQKFKDWKTIEEHLAEPMILIKKDDRYEK